MRGVGCRVVGCVCRMCVCEGRFNLFVVIILCVCVFDFLFV